MFFTSPQSVYGPDRAQLAAIDELSEDDVTPVACASRNEDANWRNDSESPAVAAVLFWINNRH